MFHPRSRIRWETHDACWETHDQRVGNTAEHALATPFAHAPTTPSLIRPRSLRTVRLISWVCVVVGVGGIMVSRVRRLECVSFLRELCSNSLLRRPTVCVRFSRDDATRSIPALSATLSISHHPSAPSAGPNLASRLDDLGVDPHLRAPRPPGRWRAGRGGARRVSDAHRARRAADSSVHALR